jgi:tetratricopeptide (TPR) repeat protein
MLLVTITEKRSMARTATFFEQLKAALAHYADPQWLGEQSPLAAPYFLGAALSGTPATASGRGAVLIALFEKALTMLWGEPLPTQPQVLLQAVPAAEQGERDRYHCLILELNYRQRCFKPAPKSQAEIFNDILHISRASHDRFLREAVERLGVILLRQIRPSLRPEQPTLPTALIGRAALLEQALAGLQAGQSVSLTGPGGIGKSALAIAISEQWASPARFWFTIRPGVNDNVSGLLFALGYFLDQQGASTLWRQLVADGGKIKDLHLASGLAHADLRAVAHRPLLCIDEIDLLRRPTLDDETPRHTQLLELIDSLRAHVSLLLVGQQSVIETQQVLALDGLTTPQIAAWLHAMTIPFDQEAVARLHHYSGGNPRLLELCVALYLSQETPATLATVLDQLPQSPAVPALWQRLQRHLSTQERLLLSTLAVFRNPAPLDRWAADERQQTHAAGAGEQDTKNVIRSLLQRRLVRRDGQDGVYLLPALRTVIYQDLGIEARQHFHLLAAHTRVQLGEYTAAAYHLCQADRPQEAVALWYPQRDEEIRRGQAGAALALFAQVSLHRLSGKRQQELTLLRSELYQLNGEPEKVVGTLQGLTWPTDQPLGLEAARLWGDALDAQGQSAAALARYDHGIEQLSHLLGRSLQLYVQRSAVHLRQRELDQARRDATLARFHAEQMLGAVADQRGDVAIAQEHYQTALAIGEALKYAAGIALIHHCLGILISRQQRMTEATPHFAKALAFYEQIGDRIKREYVRSNWAAAYIQAGEFAAVLEPAHKALRFFQQIGDSFSIAQNASNLAEAHAQLGHLAEAQHFAQIVLDQEEPHHHPYALFTLGSVSQQQAEWDKAELYFAQSKQLAQRNDDCYLVAYGWRALGEVYLATSQTDAAQQALAQAQTLFVTMGIEDEIVKCRDLLASAVNRQ